MPRFETVEYRCLFAYAGMRLSTARFGPLFALVQNAMQVFTKDEIALLKLEAARKKIADFRAKLRRMKQIAIPHSQAEESEAAAEAEAMKDQALEMERR